MKEYYQIDSGDIIDVRINYGPGGGKEEYRAIVISTPADTGDCWRLETTKDKKIVYLNPMCTWLVDITLVTKWGTPQTLTPKGIEAPKA